MALWYNELGNRILELRDMQKVIVEDGKKTGDWLATFLGGSYAEKEIESMQDEMHSIELQASQDDEWDDHWRY